MKLSFNWHRFFISLEYLCLGLIYGANIQAEFDGTKLNMVYGIIVASIGTICVLLDAFVSVKSIEKEVK